MSEIASRRRTPLQIIFEHALSVGAAALGLVLLFATAQHLLGRAVPAPQQLAATRFAPVALRPIVAAHRPASLQHREPRRHAQRSHGVANRSATFRAHPARLAPPAAASVVLAHPQRAFIRAPLRHARAPLRHARAPLRHAAARPPHSIVVRAPVAHVRATAVAPPRRAIAFVNAPQAKPHPKRRRRFRNILKPPVNYHPQPALATVPAQVLSVDIAPDSLPTPFAGRHRR